MTELVVALLMIVHGEIKEARIQTSMSECLKGARMARRDAKSHVKYQCLKGKRVAMRDTKKKVQYQCIKSMAELESNIDGSKSIKKLILD